MANKYEQINEAVQYIKNLIQDKIPTIGLILGSGLGVMADNLDDKIIIEYHNIPHFPISTVAGHAGRLVIGKLHDKVIIAMQGRFHYYEGHHISVLAFPVRVMKELGINTLIITAASGGINANLKAGSIMLITDHLNIAFTNPLIGPNLDNLGTRFPDTSNVYTLRLQNIARQVAKEKNIQLAEGTYLFTSGPTFETPAEVRMMKTLGADVCGMSTVPEALTATHCGIDVLGFTYIANMAAGISPEPLSHEEVLATMDIVKDDFLALLYGSIEKI